jgi:hypothetical protein
VDVHLATQGPDRVRPAFFARHRTELTVDA